MNEKERQEAFELIRLIYNLPEEKQKEFYYITEGAKFIAEKGKISLGGKKWKEKNNRMKYAQDIAVIKV